MADTEDTAPSRPRTAAANGTRRSSRARAPRTPKLEDQMTQLQDDLQAITHTLTRMGEQRVDEVRQGVKSEARHLMKSGQKAVADAEDEFGQLEKQIKDTIREKPLTAVAGAIALGFLFAVLTR